MSQKLDYQKKYAELRANFLAATDRAYSVGYEHGQRDAAQQQMQQQQEQQMQMAQMQAQQAGQPQEDMPMQQEEAPQDMGQFADQTDEAQLDGEQTDFESALNELEQLLGAGPEVDKAEAAKVISQITKSLSSIKEIKARMELRKSMVLQPMNKSERMKGIHKEYKKTTFGFQANVAAKQKEALSMQKAMVNSVVEKMRQEEGNAISAILKNLKTQGLAE
jgi:hypothetical protein